MNKNTSFVGFVLILSLISISKGFTQNKVARYGKIESSELKMKVYELDTNASAIVLSDVGKAYFSLDKTTHDWQIIFERHTRIKILNKNGYSYANVKIPFYDPESQYEEDFTSLKAVSYNLVDGKIIKTKMGKDAIFEERVNKYWKSRNFAIPNVKEGTIIEYSYTIKSDFIQNLREWDFQGKIPTAFSQYTVTIPQYFNYQFLSQGYEPVSKIVKNIDETFEYDWQSGQQAGGKVEQGSSSLISHSTLSIFEGTNIPAFTDVAYIDTYKNYMSKISFELISTKYDNQLEKPYGGNWNQINKRFLESSSFGQRVSQSNFLNKKVEEITIGIPTPKEKLNSVVSYVKNHVLWNGHTGIYLRNNLKNPIDEGKGSVAEINLLLTSLLQKAGITADPVLVSTRDNGVVRQSYAISDQFNYVICRAYINGEYILIDATEHFLPIGMLPIRCLNGSGWAVSLDNPGWVNLAPNQKAITRITGDLSLENTGSLKGSLILSYDGYKAREPRYTCQKVTEKTYKEDLISKSNWTIANLNIEGVQNLSEPFVEKYELSSDNDSENIRDILYLDLLVSGKIENNPFKMEDRKYPVTYPSKINELYFVNIDIPEGYQVVESPAPLVLSLPNKGGKYVLQVSIANHKITVMSKLTISKTLFVPTEYSYLKAFYAQIIAKQNEQFVLKKF